jgi:diguanylate cyclase (GGDEF)-like protein/PAS domain S-box-containing protein
MRKPLFKDKHFYIISSIFIVCTVFYYFGELVNLYRWDVLHTDMFFTVHDLQIMLFLVPILYAGYYFRLRGAILANILTLLIFLPGTFFLSHNPDAILRIAIFIIVATAISILTAIIFNERDKVQVSFNTLKRSEEKYRNILDQMYDAYYEVDLAGNFTVINDSVSRNLGYPREELLGKNYSLIVPPGEVKRLLIAFNEVYKTGEPNKGFGHQIMRKDGKILFAESSISAQKNERGEITGFRSVSRDVTERKQAEEDLRKNTDHLNEMGRIARVGGWEFDVATRLQTWTEEVYNIHEIVPDHQPTVDEGLGFYTPESTPVITKAVERAIKFGEPFDLQLSFISARGNHRWVHAVGQAYNKDGKIYKVGGTFQDITERIQSEQALHNSEERYRSLVENINDVFYILDNTGNVTYVSPVVERLSKYKVSDLVGKSFIPLVHPDDLPALMESFNRLVSGQIEPSEFRIVDKDGRIIFVRTSSRPLYENGQVVGITALITDITERKQMEQKLEQMATHDFLTGLPNRVLLTDRFTIAAALADRNKARLAVMSLDLDKFKSINDTLGHAAGDQVLKTISSRLKAIIRSSDTVARVGGDEFVLIMMETNHKEDATTIAQRILDSFREPLIIDGHNVTVSTSIGVANYPEDAQDMETLIKKSDAAMYYSKGHGRNQFKFFSDGDVRLSGDHKSGTDRHPRL